MQLRIMCSSAYQHGPQLLGPGMQCLSGLTISASWLSNLDLASGHNARIMLLTAQALQTDQRVHSAALRDASLRSHVHSSECSWSCR